LPNLLAKQKFEKTVPNILTLIVIFI